MAYFTTIEYGIPNFSPWTDTIQKFEYYFLFIFNLLKLNAGIKVYLHWVKVTFSNSFLGIWVCCLYWVSTMIKQYFRFRVRFLSVQMYPYNMREMSQIVYKLLFVCSSSCLTYFWLFTLNYSFTNFSFVIRWGIWHDGTQSSVHWNRGTSEANSTATSSRRIWERLSRRWIVMTSNCMH